jgi:hypothetical protein
MNTLFHCEQCGTAVDADNIGCHENNWCDWCMEQWCQDQMKRWWPVFAIERSYRNSDSLAQEYGDDPHQTGLVR